MLATVTASALAQARRRIGSAPLRWIFELLRGPAPTITGEGSWFGAWRICALDVTILALLHRISGTGAHYLVGVKNPLHLPVHQILADGSYLSVLAGQRIRVITATITLHTTGGDRTDTYRLVTTVTDPAQLLPSALLDAGGVALAADGIAGLVVIVAWRSARCRALGRSCQRRRHGDACFGHDMARLRFSPDSPIAGTLWPYNL